MRARLAFALAAAMMMACAPGPSSPPDGGAVVPGPAPAPPPAPLPPPPPAQPPRPPAGAFPRLLFIGNSLTIENNLAAMVEAMGDSLGLDVWVHSIVAGGFALEDHWNQGDALAAIRSGGPWDFVIMQQGPSGLPASRANLVEWAGRFGAEIRQRGAAPVMYMVWPDGARMTAFDSVSWSYRDAATAAGGPVAPAGDAWIAAWSRRSTLALYGDDNFHPSELGSYLAALTISSVIYQRSPDAFPARLGAAGRIVAVDAATAEVLRAAVRSVL